MHIVTSKSWYVVEFNDASGQGKGKQFFLITVFSARDPFSPYVLSQNILFNFL